MKQVWTMFVAVPLLATCTALGGTIIYVDDDAPAGGSGSTWSDSYRFLQDALSAAAASKGAVTEIRVAQGVYKPDRSEESPKGTGNREASFFLQENLTIVGGYRGLGAGKGERPDARNTILYPSILSGDLASDDGAPGTFANASENSYHVVVALNVMDSVVLDGFTITAGHGDGPGFGADPASKDQGSGLNVYDSSPMVIGCTFVGNWNANHGAVNDHGHESAFVDCTFKGNHAVTLGAGLYIHHHSMTTAMGCLFRENTTPGGGAGLYTRSMKGAMVSGCTFIGNVASDGAGMYNADKSATTTVNCQFCGNIAVFGAGGYSINADPMIMDCTFMDNISDEGGGGMWLVAGMPTVMDCLFVGNSGANSGALYCGDHSLPLIMRCDFLANTGQFGGGISNNDADAIVANCTFTDNSVAGGDFPVGGGINNYVCQAIVMDCVFTRNRAELGGGGAYAEGDRPEFYNCRFEGNSAVEEGNYGWGGAMLNGYTSSTLAVNCAFAGNTARLGGAIFNFAFSHPTIVNCTIAGNAAIDARSNPGGGAYDLLATGSGFANTIVWNNTPDSIGGTPSLVAYCDIQGGVPGDGNLDVDPLLAQLPAPGPDGEWGTPDDLYGDLRLTIGSPCIDAGDNTAVPATAAATIDLDHQPRFADVPVAPNLGKPDGIHPPVDIGAYELQPREACLADFLPAGPPRGDGAVGGPEFMFILDHWGPCPPPDGGASCPADIAPAGGNQAVDIDDLLAVINAWGTCP